MRKNTPLLPVEIIEQATAGEPAAVEAIIQHFSGYIKYLSYYCATKTEKTSEQQIAFPPSFCYTLYGGSYPVSVPVILFYR